MGLRLQILLYLVKSSSSSCVSLLFSDSNCSQLCVGNGTCACHDGYQLRQDGVNCEGK